METRSFDTSLGWITITAGPAGITRLDFADGPEREVGIRDGADSRASTLLDEAVAQVSAYLSGELRTFNLPLELDGTIFMKAVWGALREIPYGTVVSYAEIAAAAGRPRAARAVGMANHRNPVPIIVPCHRVIGADGSLVGYGGGLWRKKKLLELEGVQLMKPASE